MGKFVDLTGRKFGKRIVLKRAARQLSRAAYWAVLCECGREDVVSGDTLRRGKGDHCLDCKYREKSKEYMLDLTDAVFGDYRVLRRSPNPSTGMAHWVVRCSCGGESVVRGADLRAGKRKCCQQCSRRLVSRKRSGGSGPIFAARMNAGLTQKEMSDRTGIGKSTIAQVEGEGRFVAPLGRGVKGQIGFNRAFPEMRQPRPLFKPSGQKGNRQVVLKHCGYCGAVVHQVAYDAKRFAKSFCNRNHRALFNNVGPKPLDLTSTQLTNVERYGPHVRDTSKRRLDVGLMKTVKQANERQKETPNDN